MLLQLMDAVRSKTILGQFLWISDPDLVHYIKGLLHVLFDVSVIQNIKVKTEVWRGLFL